MLRSDVVQRFIDLFADASYLEIGVNQGVTFNAIKAARKVAVDPSFLFNVEAELKSRSGLEFHEITSDEYFSKVAVKADVFDVIYLDGLHTFDQTLRDLNNALFHVHERSVIIIDDTLPSSFVAALPTIELARLWRDRFGSIDGENWMGDVYRVVLYIACYLPNLSYATISDNHGQTIVWRKKDPEKDLAGYSVESIARAPLETLVTNPGIMQIRAYDEVYVSICDAFELAPPAAKVGGS